jgi:endonuclease/exonuclease/phosphatase (EEP) superfamily protein YafD
MSADRARRRSAGLSPGLAAGLMLFAVWAVGQLLRDRTLVTAWAFYLPSVLVLGALLLLAAVEALARRFRRAGVLLLLALLPAAVVLVLENHWQVVPAAHAADLRVVAWNVADFPRGVERAAALLRPLNADLVLLSEAPGRPPQELERQLGGELHLTPVGGMAVFARGEPLAVEWLAREEQLQVAFLRWAIAGRTLGVLAVNVISSPKVARDPLLAHIVDLIEQRSPDLVLGDFNAPRRSNALARLPAGYRHAYDAGGGGWSSTWPAALPLLAIDQTIVGPRLAVRGYRLRTTRISDHRLQLTELDFVSPAGGGSG